MNKRIYMMTRLAIFEEHHREQLGDVRTCFRSDYIGRQMIKNGLMVTVAYLLMLAGWGLYHVETLVVDLAQVDVLALGARILFYYAVFLSVFLVLTYSLQSIRYARAEQDLEEYRRMLDQLEDCYDEEEQLSFTSPLPHEMFPREMHEVSGREDRCGRVENRERQHRRM